MLEPTYSTPIRQNPLFFYLKCAQRKHNGKTLGMYVEILLHLTFVAG